MEMKGSIGEIMSKLLSIRLDERDKKLMNFSSKITRTPISKLLSPFILDGASISLGAAILFHMDRTTIFSKDAYGKFLDFLLSRGSIEAHTEDDYEVMFGSSPRIIWDFFEIISDQKIGSRVQSIFEEVDVGDDINYMEPHLMEELCRSIGTTYVTEGGSLSRLDQKLALKACFHEMLHLHYKNNAKGTVKALNSQWYTNRNRISELEEELIRRYEKRIEKRVVEAVEVEGEPVKALPPSDQVVAKVISERPRKRKKKIRR